VFWLHTFPFPRSGTDGSGLSVIRDYDTELLLHPRNAEAESKMHLQGEPSYQSSVV